MKVNNINHTFIFNPLPICSYFILTCLGDSILLEPKLSNPLSFIKIKKSRRTGLMEINPTNSPTASLAIISLSLYMLMI